MSTYYLLVTVLGFGNTVVNKNRCGPCPHGTAVLGKLTKKGYLKLEWKISIWLFWERKMESWPFPTVQRGKDLYSGLRREVHADGPALRKVLKEDNSSYTSNTELLQSKILKHEVKWDQKCRHRPSYIDLSVFCSYFTNQVYFLWALCVSPGYFYVWWSILIELQLRSLHSGPIKDFGF